MIALALQIRILFIVLAVGLAAYVLWRLWQRVREDPRARMAAPLLARMALNALFRRGLLPLLIVLVRLLRGMR
jgi:hypothetical protein